MAEIPRGRLPARKTAGKVEIVKQGIPGGLNKIRCPRTHAVAVPGVRADGTRVLRTPAGVEYVVRKF